MQWDIDGSSLMTFAETMKRLRCSHAWLKRLVNSGELRSAIIAGHRVFRQGDVDEYINRAFEARYNRDPFAGMEAGDADN